MKRILSVSATAILWIAISVSAPVPRQEMKPDSCKFLLCDKVENSSWALSLELQWHPDAKAEGLLRVDSWKLIPTAGGASKQCLIAELFQKARVGTTATYNRDCEYLTLVTSMTSKDHTLNTGDQRFPGDRVESCKYHEVEAQFTIYSSPTKKFTFRAIEGVETVTDIVAGEDVRHVADGRVRITVFSKNGKDYFLRAEGNLGAQQFGVERPREHGNWSLDGKVEAIANLKTAWKFESKQPQKRR